MTTLPNDPSGKIPVQQAIDWTTNWRNYLASSGQAFNKKAFLIPIESIKNILLYNENAEGIRAYLGLTDAGDADSAQLVLVPVIDNEDIVVLPSATNEEEEDSNVYDQTLSCPPYCPSNSPLDGGN